jgi:catechol 2,3-dioxygenase-like lactoylglutathione lyase family enzyme
VEPRISLITLGVRDLGRARAFYEALGLPTGAAPGDDVVFFRTGGTLLALWDRGALAEDGSVELPA